MSGSTVFLLIVALISGELALAAPQALETMAKGGQSALRAGDYDLARESFRAGQQQARAADDQDWSAKFLFYRGNVNLIEASANGAAVPALAKRAARNYQSVLEIRPDSGAAMVNLARALTLLGNDPEAKAWYERAIDLKDKNEVLYRKQYAEFLEQRDPAEAAKQLRRVVKAQPGNIKAHRQLVQAYMDPKYAARLPEYLHKEVQKGEVLRAQNAALKALADPEWPAGHKDELMRVVGASLAGQHIRPEEFTDSETAAALRRIAAADATLRASIEELFATMSSRARRVDYRWWTANAKRTATLSQLLRSLARSSAQSGQARRAEALYNNAVKLEGANDPTALRDLVDFYSERGDIAKINKVSSTYEFELFRRKGEAYARRDEQAIYDYHRTLASIYANQATRTGDWGSPDDATSAAFQLEHAYKTSQRSTSITPDPQLVDHLAQSYEATRSKNAANNIRLEAAKMYERNGDNAAAAKVLKPVDATLLRAPARVEYERLTRTRVTP